MNEKSTSFTNIINRDFRAKKSLKYFRVRQKVLNFQSSIWLPWVLNFCAKDAGCLHNKVSSRESSSAAAAPVCSAGTPLMLSTPPLDKSYNKI